MRTSNRTRALFAVAALCVLAFALFLPAWAVGVTFGLGVSISLAKLLAGSPQLDDQPEVVLVAGLVLGLLLVAVAAGAAAFARLNRQVEKPGALDGTRSRGRLRLWTIRHPWLASGVVLVCLARALGPGDSSPMLAMAFHLAVFVWLVLTSAAWVTWASWRVLRWMYVRGRESSAAAVLLGSGAALSAASWLLLIALSGSALDAARPGLQDLASQLQRQRELAPAYTLGQSLPRRSRPPLATEEDAPASAFALQRGPESFASHGLQSTADRAERITDGSFAECLSSVSEPLRRQARSEAARYVRTEEIDDVVHEALLNACLKQKPPDQAPGYFIRAVQNRGTRWRKRACRTMPVGDLTEIPDPACARYEDVELVGRILCALSPVDQELLRLAFVEGFRYREIADRLNSTEASIKHRVRSALAKARLEHSRVCPTDPP